MNDLPSLHMEKIRVMIGTYSWGKIKATSKKGAIVKEIHKDQKGKYLAL